MQYEEIAMNILLKLMEKSEGAFTPKEEESMAIIKPSTVGQAYQIILKAVREEK